MKSFHRVSWIAAFVSVVGLSGCPAMTGGNPDTACGAPGTYSHIDRKYCVCDFVGYTFCAPSDAEDFRCCEAADDPCPEQGNHQDEDGQCRCNEGLLWCVPEDPADLTCCMPPEPGTEGSTGDGGKTPPDAG